MDSINISVARSCFVRCDGCYNHFGDSTELITTETIIAFLAYAKAQGESKVTLCGGDPLARPDILPLTRAIRKLGFWINLDTVGTPLLGDAATIFFGQSLATAIDPVILAQNVDLIGIPIDGSSNESVAAFRKGRSKLLDEQIAILERLDAAAASVCVNTVVHRQNAHLITAIVPIVCRHPAVVKWQLFQYSPTGPLGSKQRARFAISDLIFEEIQQRTQTAAVSLGFTGSIEFKSNADRAGRYLLIDANGIAWTPETEGPRRRILGDINNPGDFDRILARQDSLTCAQTL